MIDDYLQYLTEQDLLYEEVLYHVAESRWKRLLATGKLTKTQLRRIQRYKGAPDPLYVKQLLKQGKVDQANRYLRKRRIVKSAKQWLAGVERGTENILKRYGAKVKHTEVPLIARVLKTSVKKTEGGATNALKKVPTIHVPSASQVSKKRRGKWILTKRHETDEVRVAKKLSKKVKNPHAVHATKVFSHISPEVLAKERELVRTAKALYGRHGGGREFSKMRKISKEYEYLDKLGKNIRKIDIKTVKKRDRQLAVAKQNYKKLYKLKKEVGKEYGNLIKQNIRNEKIISKLIYDRTKCETVSCAKQIASYIEKLKRVGKRIERDISKYEKMHRRIKKKIFDTKNIISKYY